MLNGDKNPCPGCSSFLLEPYIQCMECKDPPLMLCSCCFAKGIEPGQHQSNHKYEVVKNDFQLFEKGWTAAEEVYLLNAIGDCGIGNWDDIANQVRTKSRKECEEHYHNCYLDRPKSPLPHLDGANITYHPSPVIFKLCEDPPRPPDSSLMQQEMSGYMAARGDFTVEHDNYAELDLREIDFDNKEEIEDEVETDLKYAVLDIYHSCIKERERRKRIIQKYGLINMKKVTVFNRRFEKTLGPKIERMKSFSRLLEPDEYDKLLEALHLENELRNDITKLQEYRENGIKRLRSGSVYEVLKKRRDEEKNKRHMLTDVISNLQDEAACQQWLQRQAVIDNISKGMPLPLPSAPRKSAPPLDIVGLPGFEKLNEREREICAQVRLVPESFLEFKRILIQENNKQGYMRLAQARLLIKIDVNKTRRIFDFLVNEGHITKEVVSR